MSYPAIAFPLLLDNGIIPASRMWADLFHFSQRASCGKRCPVLQCEVQRERKCFSVVMDMTTGRPLSRMLRFFVPVLLGNLLQQFYSMADSAIVSRTLGLQAFAGVSATGALNFLIIGLALGTCSGFAIPVAQEFGAGRHSQMRVYFANSLYASGVIALLMAVSTALLAPGILSLVGTPQDIFPYSLSYIRIIFLGIPATMLYNLLSGVMRAVGDGRTPLLMLLCSTLLNVALDLLFIVSFGMGIQGAAIATILAQLISGLLCVWVIHRRFDILRITGEEWKLSFPVIARLLGIGLPMGLQFSITAIGSTILQSAVNSLGSDAVAAIGAGAKVQFVFTSPNEAVGVTMATYCGQNLGAGKIDRIRTGMRQICLIMLGYTAAAYAVQRFAGQYIALLFIERAQTQVFAWAMQYLNVVTATAYLLTLVLAFRNAIQGLGFSRVALFAGLMELIGRAFVAFVLVRSIGFDGACFANPMAWLCADLFLVPAYFIIIRRQEKIHQPASGLPDGPSLPGSE